MMIIHFYQFLILITLMAFLSKKDCPHNQDLIYKATYQVEMQENDDAPITPLGLGSLKDDLSAMKYELIFNQKNALFRVSSITDISGQSEIYGKIFTTISLINRTYYYDISKAKYAYQRLEDGLIFQYNIEDKKDCWEDLDTSINIKGMACKAAVCKSTKISHSNNGKEIPIELKAYYTTDIPVGIGPAGYHGLPGLITQVSDGRKVWKLIDIKTVSDFNEKDFHRPLSDEIIKK